MTRWPRTNVKCYVVNNIMFTFYGNNHIIILSVSAAKYTLWARLSIRWSFVVYRFRTAFFATSFFATSSIIDDDNIVDRAKLRNILYYKLPPCLTYFNFSLIPYSRTVLVLLWFRDIAKYWQLCTLTLVTC